MRSLSVPYIDIGCKEFAGLEPWGVAAMRGKATVVGTSWRIALVGPEKMISCSGYGRCPDTVLQLSFVLSGSIDRIFAWEHPKWPLREYEHKGVPLVVEVVGAKAAANLRDACW
eukprot:479688-Pleurochrysis_carterae.AAC.4